MGSVLNFIASLIFFRIAISSLRLEIAKGHMSERTIDSSWTRDLNPFSLVHNNDGSLAIKAMGFSFRFGIQDWFDFGFRIGARKPAPKPTGKEVLVHTGSGYHVRYTGSMGRRVELKDDVVCLSSHILSQSLLYDSYYTQTFHFTLIRLSVFPGLLPAVSTLDPLIPARIEHQILFSRLGKKNQEREKDGLLCEDPQIRQ